MAVLLYKEGLRNLQQLQTAEFNVLICNSQNSPPNSISLGITLPDQRCAQMECSANGQLTVFLIFIHPQGSIYKHYQCLPDSSDSERELCSMCL